MLPATTRKQLRVPHHIAIVCAGLSLASAFLIDITQTQQSQTSTVVTESVTHLKSEEQASPKPSNPSALRFDLPRLFPWAPHKPKSE